MPYLAEGIAKSGRATGKFRTIVPFKRCLLPCPLPWRASTFFYAHWHHEPDGQVSLSPGERVGVRGKDAFELPNVYRTTISWRASTFFYANWHHEPDGQVSLSPGERVGVRGNAPYNNEGLGKERGP